jgi:hypothetical protein
VSLPSHSGQPAWRTTLVLTVAAAALTVLAAFVMFSAFMFYDDEGYVLISLRNFVEHGGLYRDVYTQYGPFPFVFYYGANLLGLPLTHIGGRTVTLVAWAGAALLSAFLTTRATRSLIAGLGVLTAVFVYLWVMASEPTHPGGLIVLLTAVLAAIGYRWIADNRLPAWALATGAGVAALILTKINIGGFAACAALSWWLIHHKDEWVRRCATWVLPAAAVLLPLVLMRSLIDTPWVRNFALVFACSATAAFIAVKRGATARVGWDTLAWGGIGGGGLAIIVLGVALLRGTSMSDLVEGILLAPMRHPATFSLRFLWPPGIALIAIGSLGLCAGSWFMSQRRPLIVDTAVAVLRIILAAGVAINAARYPMVSPDYLVFGWVMPVLWLFLWPLSNEEGRTTQPRAWVGLMLLGQCLHVFPVPGSQIAWGSVLVVPLAAIGAWDAASWLRPRLEANGRRIMRIGALTLQAGVLGVTFLTGWKFAQVAGRYRDDPNLDLPGAEVLHLPEDFSTTLRMLVLNALVHGDVLFSFPGMFSLNIWSGVPTPTLANTTHWFSLLDTNRQQAIIRALEAHPRACVVVHRHHVRFLTGRGLPPRGPLREYIDQTFEPAFTFDDFEFCVRKGRTIQPLMVGDILTRANTTEATSGDRLLRIAVLLPGQKAIGQIELANPMGNDRSPIILDPRNARIEVQPANLRGEPVGPAKTQNWPLAVEGPALISFYYDNSGQTRPPREALIIFRGVTGEKIAIGRLRE